MAHLCNLHLEEVALLRLLRSLGLEKMHRERDLHAAAEHGDGLVELLAELFYAAINCTKKDTFLKGLKKLSTASQLTLQDFIQTPIVTAPSQLRLEKASGSLLEPTHRQSQFRSQELEPAHKPSSTRDRRDTLTALMVAEGTLPRTSADFGLSVENATLKMERDKLARELWDGAQKQEAAAATEKARLAGLSMIYEQKLKTLQEKVERLESSLRESRQVFYEEKTQLLASSRAIELQLAERQKELQQLKSERASLAEDLAQAYRLKDDWTNKYLGCRDEALSLSKELASRATRMCVLEREVSRLSEHQVDTQETERVDVETERLRARVSKLAGQLRRREDRVAGLKREREELRMALAKERQVMKEVLRESHGTLRELGSLLDSRSV